MLNYSSGAGIEFGDAIQRAEFWHEIKSRLAHESASGCRGAQHYDTVPRFITVDVNGFKTQVQTYFSEKPATAARPSSCLTSSSTSRFSMS